MSKNLQVTIITKAALRSAVEKNLFWEDVTVPIPKSKAYWLLQNNRIEEEDCCGVIAYEEDKIISFVYLVPDFIKNELKELKKVYWMLLWWTNKKYDGTVLSTYIYNEALNACKQQVLLKSYAEKANPFYEKQPYSVISERLRHTLFFGLEEGIIIGRYPQLEKIKYLIRKLNIPISFLLLLINKKKVNRFIKNISYERLNKIDDKTWEYIESLCKNDIIYKTKEYINWQLDTSQYTQTAELAGKPIISLQVGVGKNIATYKIKVLEKDTIVGFIAFTLNSKEINLKYFLVKEKGNYKKCVAVLMDYIISLKAQFLFTDNTELSDEINKNFKVVYTYKITKKAIAHNKLEFGNKKFNVQDQDGHFY